MITETKNDQIYSFIGNDICNLIRINDDRLHGNIKSLSNEEFKKIKFLNSIPLEASRNDIFSTIKQKIQDEFIKYCILGHNLLLSTKNKYH